MAFDSSRIRHIRTSSMYLLTFSATAFAGSQDPNMIARIRSPSPKCFPIYRKVSNTWCCMQVLHVTCMYNIVKLVITSASRHMQSTVIVYMCSSTRLVIYYSYEKSMGCTHRRIGLPRRVIATWSAVRVSSICMLLETWPVQSFTA